MDVVFLGTSSMVPTKERNQIAVLAKCHKYDVLLDCGEGTQRQFKHAQMSPFRTNIILLSHWHGDHTLGLPGLMQTLANAGKESLTIIGPKGTRERINSFRQCFIFEARIPDLTIIEIEKDGLVYEDDHLSIEARLLEHVVPCFGYSITESSSRRILKDKTDALGIPDGPLLGQLQRGESIVFDGKEYAADDLTTLVAGKKLTYLTDTALCDNCMLLAKNADLLICEATFADDLEEKADKTGHMTTMQAAGIAKDAAVRSLVLNHFSQRYSQTDDLVAEAKTVFDTVVASKDFLRIQL